MHPKEVEHMRKRKESGLTYRELGPEFGVSKSHAHRILKGEERINHPDESLDPSCD